MMKSMFTCNVLLLGASLVATESLVAKAGNEATAWTSVKAILDRSAGTYDQPQCQVVTPTYTGGTLLGNGEITAMVAGNAEKQMVFFNRLDFWNKAMGGLTITAAGSGSDPATFQCVQDIRRGEVRTDATLSGHATKLKAWCAPTEPLVFVELENNSSEPVAYTVAAWSFANRAERDKDIVLLRGIDASRTGCSWVRNRTGNFFLIAENGALRMKPECQTPLADGRHLWRKVATNKPNEWLFQNVGNGCYLEAKGDDGFSCTSKMANVPSTRWRADGSLLVSVATGRLLWCDPATGEPVMRSANALPHSWYSAKMPGFTWSFVPITYGNPGGSDRNDGQVISTGRSWSKGSFRATAAIVMRPLGDGSATFKDGTTTLTLPPHARATLAIAVEGGSADGVKSMEEYRLAGRSRLLTLDEPAIRALAQAREDKWKTFWSRSFVDTGDLKLNQCWYGSYYSLACSGREGQPYFGIWGGWINDDHSRYNNEHFCNYNCQSPFYGVFSGNHPELADTYFDAVMTILPGGMVMAHRAGYRGACFKRVFGYVHPDPNFHATWKAPPVAGRKNRSLLLNDQLDVTAFLAMNFINRWRYTQDEAFLRSRAWPLMITCADFYEDCLTFNKANNRYEMHNSAAREGTSDINAAYTLAFIRFVYRSCLEVADCMNVPVTQQGKWRHILAHLSEYPMAEINGARLLKECESNKRITYWGPGDNSSLLQVVQPGEGIGLDSDPKLIEAGLNTLRYLNAEATGRPEWLKDVRVHFPGFASWNAENNFPQIFAQAAYLGWDAADLHEQLRDRISSDMRPNLTATESGGGIETAGASEAINAMLLQSHEGVIRFFPVWPRDKDAKFGTLRAVGAFLVSAELKNGVVRGVRISSEKGKNCTIQNPWPGNEVRVTRNGKSAESIAGARFTLKTSSGERLELYRVGGN